MTRERDERVNELHPDLLECEALERQSEQPTPGLRATLLATVASGFEGFVPRVARLFDLSAERAREILAQMARAPSDPWEDDRVEGVRLLHFVGGPRMAEADCGLVHVEPGRAYPLHRHRGDEWALVLQGTAVEDSGRVWRAGDLLHKPAGSAHSFRVRGPEPFVFAVALHEGLDFEQGVPES